MYETYLYHHGIKGMKWGIRRFQNPDGTRTPAGKKRYGGSGSGGEVSGDYTEKKGLSDKQKKALKVGLAVVGTAAVAAGVAYAVHKSDVNLTKEMQHHYANKAKEYLGERIKNERLAKIANEDAYYAKVDRDVAFDNMRAWQNDQDNTKWRREAMTKVWTESYDRAKNDYNKSAELAKKYRDLSDKNDNMHKLYRAQSEKDKYSRVEKQAYKKWKKDQK